MHFPTGRNNQPFELESFEVLVLIRMIYSSVARILCSNSEVNRTRPHTTTVFVEISTSNTNLIDYSIQLDNVTEYYLE